MTATISGVDWDSYRAAVAQGLNPQPDTAAWQVREEIILTYLYLTKRVVSKMMKAMPTHVERDDLESWATIGLMKAVQRFNHQMGVPFEAFATQSMRSAIMDGIREQDWVPRSLRRKQRDIDKAEEELKQKLGRTPTDYETAEALGLESKEIGFTKYKSEIASHTYIDGSSEALNKYDNNPEEVDLALRLRTALATALENLPVKEATVIALHYYDEQKLSSVAKIMGISEVKIGALHSSAVLSLWNSLENLLTSE